jgi:copper(I)-binding protein
MPRAADVLRLGAARRRIIARIGVALVGLLAFALAPTGHAHSYKQGEIAVGHIWAPPTSQDGAVYGSFMNQGGQQERLVEASSPIADAVRFRAVEDGHTRWSDAIDIAPGKVVPLAPWREHLWLTGLKRPLREGDSFEMTLVFEKAGALTVTVLVEQVPGH